MSGAREQRLPSKRRIVPDNETLVLFILAQPTAPALAITRHHRRWIAARSTRGA